jgi:hypothetical protein
VVGSYWSAVAAIYNLQKKHQVATIDELLEIQAQLENSVLNSEI